MHSNRRWPKRDRPSSLAERKIEAPWPGFDAQTLVEFELERCLLTLTEAGDHFRKGHTVWKAS